MQFRIEPKKDQNKKNPRQIFKIFESVSRDPSRVKIWAPSSFWALRYLSSKLVPGFGCSSNYLFPISDMNQKSRRGTENLKIGVWISSFFYVKAMCWGLLGKMHPRPGTNSLVSKTGLGFFFALDFRYWISLTRRERGVHGDLYRFLLAEN